MPEATPRFPTLGAVLARNVAVRRAEMGWSQAGLARGMEYIGVAWTQSTVALVETGKRPVKAVELVALSAALRVAVAALLDPGDDEAVTVGGIRWDSLVVRKVTTSELGQDFTEVVNGHIHSRHPTPEELQTVDAQLASLLAVANHWGPAALPAIASIGSTEREACLRIRRQARLSATRLQVQVQPADVGAAAWRLWQSNYEAERERRVSERLGPDASARSRQAARGHVVRQIDQELLEEIKEVLGTITATTAARRKR